MKGFKYKDICYLWKANTPNYTSNYSMIREEIKFECQESDESDVSDEESYVGELTISELAAGFTETCLMNDKLSAKAREYRSINRFLLEERLPRTPIFLQTANNPVGPSCYLLRLNCSDSSHKRDTNSSSKSFRMFQQSCYVSPKKVSPIYDSVTPDESSNPNRVLNVVPLRMISSDDVKATKPRTAQERRPKEGIQNKGAKPSSSNTREELTKEGTRYVQNSLAKIVKRILEDNHQVLEISVPLQTIFLDHLKITSEAKVAHTSDHDPVEGEINKDGQGGAENTNVTQDDNDIEASEDNEHNRNNAETTTNVVDLDEYSDNKLLASLNPSVANKIMTRRKGKAVVPKKRKEREIVESESDVEVDVPDIPSRKKPTTSKIAASIPEVPIDNVSFHYASSASRWKYMLQKRLAGERELAPNAPENKEIFELIQEAGLLKTIYNLPKCYERLVKEFTVNLSEDFGNNKSVDFRKVFVRGKWVSFSPSVINNLLERTDEARPELEVTDNKVCQVITAKQVKSWPLKEKLTVSKLSIKYAMLHKIGATNWVPTYHKSTISTILGRFLYAVGTKAKFDYGTYIFDQTMKHAGSFNVKGPISFPSLLCGIILNQYPNILNEHDIVCKRESPLAFHYKLF
ncbi:uncharacterized protein LOC131636213 [Vicia villosa]|uniref:uncharacterized protein LOC131636213 n=1 Tax=Vicia villosa TaxID=3911 RepID=UPI00273A8325|nr:uncharacterized protein LOC131636213 [Vicia villosa]